MASVAPLQVALAPPPRKVDWPRARTALRSLVDDPERTDRVFDLIEALAGNSGECHFQRFLRAPGAASLLARKPSLVDALRDLPRLEALLEGSLGATYARFMRAGRIQATGLVDASDQIERREETPLDPDRTWFYDRLRDMHDLWHVLTGYGTDVAGESANLAFTYAQTRNRGVGVIVLASMYLGPKTLDCYWQRYLWRACQRGRRAVLLSAAPYEALLAQPVEQVRQTLRIQPAEIAHPHGILVERDGVPIAPLTPPPGGPEAA